MTKLIGIFAILAVAFISSPALAASKKESKAYTSVPASGLPAFTGGSVAGKILHLNGGGTVTYYADGKYRFDGRAGTSRGQWRQNGKEICVWVHKKGEPYRLGQCHYVDLSTRTLVYDGKSFTF